MKQPLETFQLKSKIYSLTKINHLGEISITNILKIRPEFTAVITKNIFHNSWFL